MALARARAGHEAHRAEIERLAPGTRVAVPNLRTHPVQRLSASKQRGLLAGHAAALAPLNDEMRRDGASHQRRIRESIARSGGRTRVVGDPTAFAFNFNAARVTPSTVINTAFASDIAFVSPIATSTTAGRNGSRFLAFALSQVGAFSGAIVQVDQTTRFTFTGCPAGAVTITALLGLTGSFKIVAPGAQFQFPDTVVPTPNLFISATVSIVAFSPTAPPNLRLTVPFPTFGTLLDRRVASPQGPVTDLGFLQSFTPSSMTALPFPVVASATITVDVTIGVQLFTQSGGSVLVDCLSAPTAGLVVPGVMLRVDF
jgi:hypothetical protein